MGKEWIKLVHKSYLASAKGNHQKSIQLAQRALELNPNYSEAWRLIGNAYELLGDEAEDTGVLGEAFDYHRKAIDAWDVAKSINPKIKIPGYHK